MSRVAALLTPTALRSRLGDVDQGMRFKLLGGLPVRRADYGVVNFVMGAGRKTMGPTMTTGAVDYAASYFKYKTPTPIQGAPTNKTLKEFAAIVFGESTTDRPIGEYSFDKLYQPQQIPAQEYALNTSLVGRPKVVLHRLMTRAQLICALPLQLPSRLNQFQTHLKTRLWQKWRKWLGGKMDIGN